MEFCEKLVLLRKEFGYSQEQLANILNISRQSVSKWESGQTMPELGKLVQIADLFHVSTDYLLRENVEEKSQYGVNRFSDEQNRELKQMISYMKGYEYKSKRTFKGIPLVHIHLNTGGFHKPAVARGIIAIGDVSIGVVSLGGFSVGVFGGGGISLGGLAVGGVAFGLAAFGGVAIGLIAAGACAIGFYAFGAAALGSKLAIGAAAVGGTAIGKEAQGTYVLLLDEIYSRDQVRQFLVEHVPGIWKPFLEIICSFFHQTPK